MRVLAASWRSFGKMAATAARGQFGDGSTPKFFHYILIYLCAKIGAFIKKCTIGLNILGRPPHYQTNNSHSYQATHNVTLLAKHFVDYYLFHCYTAAWGRFITVQSSWRVSVSHFQPNEPICTNFGKNLWFP